MAEMPMPAEGVPAAEAGTEGGGGEFVKLAGNVLKGMSLLGEGLEKAGAPPPVLEGLMGLMEQFESLISSLGGEGGGGEAPQKSSSPVQEAQGRPVSPAGV